MHEKAAFIFWVTLILYVTTLFTVSYVGVYLTYIAIPFIALSGIVMLIAKPSKKSQENIDQIKATAKSTTEAASVGLQNFSTSIDELSKSALVSSIKLRLESEKCWPIEKRINQKEEKKRDIRKNFVSSRSSSTEYRQDLKEVDEDIETLKAYLLKVRAECANEADRKAREQG